MKQLEISKICLLFIVLILFSVNSVYSQNMFAPSVEYPLGTSPYSIFFADFNNDGKPDIVTANYNSDNVSVLFGVGDGTFLSMTNYLVGYKPLSVFAADFNNDGFIDIVTANEGSDDISILFNNGNGTFQTQVNYHIDNGPVSIVSVDFENDSDNDLVVGCVYTWYGNVRSKVVILKNDGFGNFQVTSNFNPGGQLTSVIADHLNDDSYYDLVVTDQLGGYLRIFINNGDDTFELTIISFNIGSDPVSVFSSDLDNDGDNDLVVANSWNWNTTSSWVSTLMNNGDGTFQPAVQYETGGTERSVYCSDFDSDGDNDIAVISTPNVSILRNNCDGTFQGAGNYMATGANSLFATDFDNDGDVDLVTTGPNSISVLLNIYNEQFQTPVPTFLVHGLSDDAESWNTMKTWLKANGHPYVYAVDNLEPCGVVGESGFSGNASLLSHYIDSVISVLESCMQVDITTINLIGHSMGGLISRRYISDNTYNPKNVKNLIMLGTPNKGSGLSNTTLLQGFRKCPSGPAIIELSNLSMLTFNLTYQDNSYTNYYSVWGTRNHPSTALLLFTPNDGVVSRNSAVRDQSLFFFKPIYKNNYGNNWCHSTSFLLNCNNSYLEDVNLFSSYINPILNDQAPILNKSNLLEEEQDIPPQLIEESAYSIIAGSSITDSVYVEANGNLTISLFASDSLMGFSLESPFGIIYDSSLLLLGDPSKIYFNDSLGTIGFYIENADEGYWHWTADASNATSTVDILVLAGIDNSVVLTINQNLEYLKTNDTLNIAITVTDNSIGVQGLSVVALPIWNGVDTLTPITLLDDGLHGDLLANDGTYGIMITSLDSGSVEFKIIANGVAPSGIINRLVSIFAYSEGPCCVPPIRGNANGGADDGTLAGSVTVADLVFLVAYMFQGGAEPVCLEEADINGSGGVTPISITDLVSLVAFMFQGGVAPAICP